MLETQPNKKFPQIRSDRYRIDSVLGAGAVGTVYQAHDSLLDKTVAIKKLHRSASSEEAIRFHREAKLAGTLSHPNVLSVLDFGITEENEPYLVLNYVQGTSLSERINEHGALPASEAVPLFIQLSRGLIHAHSKNVIHRDVKPSNVMLLRNEDDGRDTAMLVDFGLAKSTGEQQELTKSGVGVGTPMFMSPEQIRGEQVDERTDIYSLGCLMYEVLTGLKPFQTDQLLELIELKMHHLPEAVSETAPYEVPERLSDIVDKCMEIDREDRFSSAAELLAALESVSVPCDTSVSLDGRSSAVATVANDKVYRVGGQGPLSILFRINWRVALIVLIGLVALAVPILIVASLAPIIDDDPETERVARRLDKFTKGKSINSYVGSKVDDDDLIAFIRKHPGEIDELHLRQSTVTERSLAFLEHEKVTGLSLRDFRKPITEEVFRAISKMESLRILRFSRNENISFESFYLLNNSPNLFEIDFDEQEFGPNSLSEVGKVRQITRLELQRMPGISKDKLKVLAPMKNLKELYMNTTDLDDEGIKALVELKLPIRKLICDLTCISPKSLEQALRMPDLELLSVAACEHLTHRQVVDFDRTHKHRFEIHWKPEVWAPNSHKSVP